MFIQNEEVNDEVDVNVTSIDQSAVTVNKLIQREIVLHTDPDTFEQSFTVQELLDAENVLLRFVQL